MTREVGSLKEDLHREVKRRERATVSVREAEELRQEAEKRVKQLEYAKRCVTTVSVLPCNAHAEALSFAIGSFNRRASQHKKRPKSVLLKAELLLPLQGVSLMLDRFHLTVCSN